MNPAPIILGLTVAVAFGAGAIAQNASGDVSGKAMIETVLPILGVGLLIMVWAQRRHFDRQRHPAGEEAAWAVASRVMRNGQLMVVLIVVLMIPALLTQNVKLVVLAAIPIVLFAVVLAIRTVMPGGTLDQAYDAADQWVAQYGLRIVQRPQLAFSPGWVQGGSLVRHDMVGPLIFEGERNGRPVRVVIENGRSVTTVADVAFETEDKDGRQWLRSLAHAEHELDSGRSGAVAAQ